MPASGSSTSLARREPVVLATTVLLSFISFWRAAAIVLSDLGSTAYYIGGIAEQAIGKAAPWFILGVMLFSYAVRAVYIESSAMFVRGGVYRVVKEAMGGHLAKMSVSALLFDYVLTGPISGVAAGLYIAGLANDLSRAFGGGAEGESAAAEGACAQDRGGQARPSRLTPRPAAAMRRPCVSSRTMRRPRTPR